MTMLPSISQLEAVESALPVLFLFFDFWTFTIFASDEKEVFESSWYNAAGLDDSKLWLLPDELIDLSS